MFSRNSPNPIAERLSIKKKGLRLEMVQTINLTSQTIQMPGLTLAPFVAKGNVSSVSVIIPTFNERENIVSLVRETCCRLHKNVEDYEVIIVDDASPDGTSEIAKALTKENGRVKLVCRPGKMGLGSAIMDGVKCSVGEVIIPIDADFSHPPSFILRLLEKTNEFDVVVGSRYINGGEMVAPFQRIFLSRMLNFFIRTILGLHVRDCTGGFMAVHKHVFNPIFVKGKSGDYAFELLYKAQKRGSKIVEVPFTYKYRERGESKTDIIRYGLQYVLSALLLRIRRERLVDA